MWWPPTHTARGIPSGYKACRLLTCIADWGLLLLLLACYTMGCYGRVEHLSAWASCSNRLLHDGI